MNSSEESENVIAKEEMPSGSRPASDKNANTNNNPDQCKGAIPKTKIAGKNGVSGGKKSVKINNNTDSMPQLNCVVSGSSDILKKNGFTKNGTVPNNFLNNSALLSDQESNCGVNNKGPDPFNYEIRTLAIPVENDYLKVDYSEENTFDNLYQQNPSDFEESQRSHANNDSDSCSSDTELLSVSDDGCIYTYKADYVADLPRSFFNLDIPINDNVEQPADNKPVSGKSSPEMDFLEMDFEPEPTGDAEGGVYQQPQQATDVIKQPVHKPLVNEASSSSRDPWKPESDPNKDDAQNNYETFSKILSQFYDKKLNTSQDKNDVSVLFGNKTKSHDKVIHKLDIERNCWLHHNNDVEMIWTEQEAAAKQISQISTSSCGATAVLNVLNALRLPLPTIDQIEEMMNTRFRTNSAPLVKYLMSRSKAGCNHRDIIRGLYAASDGQVYCRFFSMHPPRAVNLKKWLGYWIKQGAVPVATLNLQIGNYATEEIPDNWHHQMIYGVGPSGVYTTNPLDCVDPETMMPQLSSESVLLIKRRHVLAKFHSRTGLADLMKITDVRWKDVNVVGQVANMVRENRRVSRFGSTVTSHLKIPADYKAGVTLAMHANNPALPLLRQCPELPLLTAECK